MLRAMGPNVPFIGLTERLIGHCEVHPFYVIILYQKDLAAGAFPGRGLSLPI